MGQRPGYFDKRRKDDIQLPSEGRRDPRLGPEKPDVLGQLRKSAEGLKMLKEKGLLGGIHKASKK